MSARIATMSDAMVTNVVHYLWLSQESRFGESVDNLTGFLQ